MLSRRQSLVRFAATVLATGPALCGNLNLLAQSAPTAPETMMMKAFMDQFLKGKPMTLDLVQEKKLKDSKRIFSTPGKVWFDGLGGRFRFELGSPTETLAVRKGEGQPVFVVEPKAQTATRYAADSKEIKALSFLDSSDGSSAVNEMQDRVTLEKSTSQGSVVTLHLKVKGGIASWAITKIELVIDLSIQAGLNEVRLSFADGSTLNTRVVKRSYGTIPASTWEYPLEGLKITDK